jgi:hypothetical protein
MDQRSGDQKSRYGFGALEKEAVWDRWVSGESLKAIGRAVQFAAYPLKCLRLFFAVRTSDIKRLRRWGSPIQAHPRTITDRPWRAHGQAKRGGKCRESRLVRRAQSNSRPAWPSWVGGKVSPSSVST